MASPDDEEYLPPPPVPTIAQPKGANGNNPLEQIERLLTCPICLDRYKQPKLLSCQHTFCLSCLESYVDSTGFARPRVRCPECRAETAVEAGNVQSLQTNLTLMSFLEIHLEASEVNAAEMQAYVQRFNLERCRVCEEKAELELCAHCERKCCAECRAAHVDMLKRDLGRLLGQVRRLSSRVMDASKGLSRGLDQLAANGEQTKSEIRDYFNRYQKELRRREDNFIEQVDVFVATEDRLMRTLRDTLDVEWNNLQDACLWVDAALGGEVAVRGDELARFKTVFAQGLEYLRSFQPDSEDLFAKKVRFSPGDDAAKLPTAIANFGELNVSLPQFANRFLPLEQQYLPRPFRLGLESEHFMRGMGGRGGGGEAGGGGKYGSGGAGRMMDEEEGRGGGGGKEEGAGAQRWRRRRELEDEAWSRLRVFDSAWSSSGRGTPSGALSPLTIPTIGGGGGSASPTRPISPAPAPTQLGTAKLGGGGVRPSAERMPKPEMAKPKSVEVPKPDVKKGAEVPKPEAPKPKPADVPKPNPAKPKPEAAKPEPMELPKPEVPKSKSEVAKPKPAEAPKPEAAPKPEVPKPELIKLEVAKSKQEEAEIRDDEAGTEPLEGDTIVPASTSAEGEQKTKKEEGKEPEGKKAGETAQKQTKNGKAEGPTQHRGRLLMVNGGAGNSASGGNKATHNSPHILPLPADSDPPVQTPRRAETETMKGNNPNSSSRKPPLPSRQLSMGEEPMKMRGKMGENIKEGEELLRGRRKMGMRKKNTSEEEEEEEEEEGGRGRRQEVHIRTQGNRFRVHCRSSSHDSRRGSSGSGKLDMGQPIPVAFFPTSSTGDWASSTDDDPDPPGLLMTRSRSNPDFLLTSCASLREALEGRPRPKVRKESREEEGRKRREENEDRKMGGRRGRGAEDEDEDEGKKDEAEEGWMQRIRARPRLVLGGRGAAPEQMNWPRGVCALPPGTGGDDDLFAVADSSNHRVQIFSATEGALIRTFGTFGNADGEFDGCCAVCVNSARGELLVADRYNHRVQMFDLEGRFLRKFGCRGSQPGQFQHCWGIAVDEQLGLIYVADKDNHRVQLFDAEGAFLTKFGSMGDGPGQFNHPLYLAFHPSLRLLFVSDSANNRISVFAPDGTPVRQFGGNGAAEGQLKLPRGIAVDQQGRVVVADSGNNRLQLLSPGDDRCVRVFGTWGTAPGQFKGVEGVCLVGSGGGQMVVVVADRENNRVQLFA